MNVALIGLPGCGKTTLGRMLAEETGWKFVDADAEIERASGMTIPEMFSERGEAFFRDAEEQTLWDILREDNIVLATGGGVILRENNRFVLRNRARVVFVDRPVERILDGLETEGRPLLKDGARALYALRDGRDALYRACAHDILRAQGDPMEALREMTALLRKEKIL